MIITVIIISIIVIIFFVIIFVISPSLFGAHAGAAEIRVRYGFRREWSQRDAQSVRNRQVFSYFIDILTYNFGKHSIKG
jgi:hypothetical protein